MIRIPARGAVLALCATYALAASPTFAADTAVRVLVLSVEGNGVDAVLAARATTLLADAISKRPGHLVATSGDLAQVLDLEQARSALACDTDEACMAALAAQLSAELVVRGSLGKVGDDYTLAASVHRGATIEVVSRDAQVFKDESALSQATATLVNALFPASAQAPVPPPVAANQQLASSYAVLPLSATGVDAATAKNLSHILTVELKARATDARVVALDDVAAMLELTKQKTVLTCASDLQCLVEIGDALGVAKIVVGEVGVVGEEKVVALRLIDREQVMVEQRVTESFRGSFDQLIPATRAAVRALMGGPRERVPGAMLVTSNEPGASVLIDGWKAGELPAPPFPEVDVGRRAVLVTKEGFFDWQGDVYVEPGETAALYVELEARPLTFRPFLPVWGFAALGGVSVAFAASAVTTGSLALLFMSQYGDDVSGRNGPIIQGSESVAKLRSSEAMQTTTNILWAATGVSAIATLAAIPLTKWEE